MGEALLFNQNNSANSGTKHKEQWLSIEDPDWITVHNNITLPNPSNSTSTITLKMPYLNSNGLTSYEYTVFNGLTQLINLTPNSIICIKNIFTTTQTSNNYTNNERYVIYYDSQYNKIGQSAHDFSRDNFSKSKTATAYPCSIGMGSQQICDQNYGIVQLVGNKNSYNSKYGILVPKDGIVNIAIGTNTTRDTMPMTCTTQYSYINFLEHFSEEEYEYHKTLKSIESNNDNTSYSQISSYFNQISNSYIPTVNAVNEVPREDSIFFYNGTLYAYYFYTDINSSNGIKYKVYK